MYIILKLAFPCQNKRNKLQFDFIKACFVQTQGNLKKQMQNIQLLFPRTFLGTKTLISTWKIKHSKETKLLRIKKKFRIREKSQIKYKLLIAVDEGLFLSAADGKSALHAEQYYFESQ